MTKKIDKLVSISEDLYIHRYDNGFMVETSGRDKKGEYKTLKIICNTEEEVVALVKEANLLPLDQ